MPSYKRWVKADVAHARRIKFIYGWEGPWDDGFEQCIGWHHHLCPMEKLVAPCKLRCSECSRNLRDAMKEKAAAKKAVRDVWSKFEAPATIYKCAEIDSSEDEGETEGLVADDEPTAEASDPLAAHKLATILGARGECGFESLGKDEGQRLDKMNEPSILYETISRLAYIADPNVITREERKAASRCGGLPVRPPYLLPRVGMPHVADTEDSVYLAFVVKLGQMTLQDLVVPTDEKLRALHFFKYQIRRRLNAARPLSQPRVWPTIKHKTSMFFLWHPSGLKEEFGRPATSPPHSK